MIRKCLVYQLLFVLNTVPVFRVIYLCIDFPIDCIIFSPFVVPAECTTTDE